MVNLSNRQEIYLTHGEVGIDIEYYDKKIVDRWGGQDVVYRFSVRVAEAFDEVGVLVSAFVKNEPFIELEFVDAETLDDKDFILGSTEDNPDGFTNTTAGEMLKELVEKHDFLCALTEAFHR